MYNSYEWPITYFEDNLIFNAQRECWAAYRLKGVSYDHLSSDKKISLLNAATRFVSNIGTDAKILIIPVAQDVEGHYDRIIAKLDKNDEMHALALNHAKGTKEYLKERLDVDGISNDYQVYVITKLPRAKKQLNFTKIFDSIIRRPVQTINEFIGADVTDISESDIRLYKNMADAYFASQNSRLRLEKVETDTVQWLYRRMFHRGLKGGVTIKKNEKEMPWSPMYSEVRLKDGQKIIRPYKRDILTLTEAEVKPDSKGVTVFNSDDKISYQTFLAMSHIPDGIAFPGGEWLYLLQDWPVATEVCISITTIEHKAAGKKLEEKNHEINSQIEHVAKSAKVTDDLWEAAAGVQDLERELQPGSEPLCSVSVSLCIAADDPGVVKEASDFVRGGYDDMKFGIERPRSDQMKLFMEFIPGAGSYINDYNLWLPPKTVAGSMFAATSFLGDSEGHYIGTTGVLRKNVYLNIAKAFRMNRSASIALLGTLGGGKSFNANLLAFLAVLTGAYSLFIDPKGERHVWLERLPAFAPYMSVTTLSAGKEDQGKLDPFSIFEDVDEASELAKNIICELYEINSKDDEYLALTESLLAVQKLSNPSMLALEETLLSFPEDDELSVYARRLARRISATKKIGMARLLFGDGSQNGLSFDKRINILQIQNLNLPDPETPKGDYTELEKVSTVLMIPVVAFAKKFAMSNRKVFKTVIFDESWALNATQVGSALFNYLARMGRSLYANAIFIGHSVTDLKGDGIKAAITYKFAFKATVQEEIIRILEWMDLEATDENIELVKNLPNRTCLFQDLEGRVGVLEFDAVWADFIDAFDTTPDA